jgi:L-malate glycosyltransferase
MDKRLNILFTSSWYPNRTNSFAGNFVKRHAEAVAKYCNVTVLYFQSDSSISKTEIQLFESNNLKEIICYYPKITSRLPFVFHFKNFRRIVSIANKLQSEGIINFNSFNVLHHNVTYPIGTVASYIKEKFSLPLVLTEHSTRFLGHPDDKMTFIERLVAKYVLKKVDVLCPVSKNLEQAILKDFPIKKLVVVKNVVDANVFSAHNKKPSSITTFLHVSTLQNQQKNVFGLIEAFSLLSKNREDFVLKIIGDGDSSELMAAIQKFNLPNECFEFLGVQPITKVAEAMRQSDALVLFSNFENLPCVISEAHMVGLPVLSTNVGGISEMIDEKMVYC